jgi:hypothetical protein
MTNFKGMAFRSLGMALLSFRQGICMSKEQRKDLQLQGVEKGDQGPGKLFAGMNNKFFWQP